MFCVTARSGCGGARRRLICSSAYDPFHFHAAERVRPVPFVDTILVLAPEDLLVCKVVFNRRKDWIDIEQMLLLTAGALDLEDVRRWSSR